MPECDDSSGNAKYDAEWVKDVLPGKVAESSGIFQPELCMKYVFKNETIIGLNESCQAHWFEHEQQRCDRWVFDMSERTIVNDVSDCNLICTLELISSI